MLPDFPRIKKRWAQVSLQFVAEQSSRDNIISMFQRHRHFEGDRMPTGLPEPDPEDPGYKQLSAKLEVDIKDIIEKGPNAVLEKIKETSEVMKRQQSKLLFDTMNKVTTHTGNTIDAEGKPFSPELFLKMIEKMDIDFDENGNPLMPTIVVSPEQGKKIQEKAAEWEADPKGTKDFEELIEKKRKEYNDRESNRKLVD